MLQPPKTLLFALEAVVDIAYQAGPDPVQSREITERQGIPQRYLEQVMQRLVRAQILKGTRGPRGGYRLARERRRISVGEIARVVAALDNNGDEAGDGDGSPLGRASVRPMWQELQSDLMARLDGISIEDLCRRAHEQGIAREAGRRLDFNI